jgi:hypothetical protein
MNTQDKTGRRGFTIRSFEPAALVNVSAVALFAPKGAEAGRNAPAPIPGNHRAKSVVAVAVTLLVLAQVLNAQTIILSENFDGAFPGAWTVSGNPTWLDVNATFGGEGTHSGNWKGYCAGTAYPWNSSELNPIYAENMDATLSRTINLAGYTRVFLNFWYKIPAIENGYDFARIRISGIESVVVWSQSSSVSSWAQASIDLSAHAGTSCTIVFEFLSDYSNQYEGWYLDDIEVIGYSAPANDQCYGAIPLGSCSAYSMHTGGATSAGDPTPTCRPSFGNGVWFVYTPASSGTVSISTCGSGFDTVLEVYTGSCGSLTSVACNDDYGPICPTDVQASVSFTATAGNPYYILAGGYAGAYGPLLIRVLDTQLPTAICPGNIVADADVGQNSKANVTFSASVTDNCPGASVSCNPPSGSTFLVGTTTVTCTATDTSGNTSQCSFTVTIRALRPSNDDFANAAVLGGATGNTSGSSQNATRETGEPYHAGNVGGTSVWFRWQAPSSGTVTFNTAGTAFDTLLAVYTGASVSALTPVVSNDDIQSPDRTSAVTFNAVAGTEYRIALDGYNGASGNYTLNWLYPVVNETILSVAVTNLSWLGSVILIDSDAFPDLAMNRKDLRVSASVRSDNTSGAAHWTTYVLSYRLLNAQSQPHPILDSNGQVNGSYTCNYTNTVLVPAYGSASLTHAAALRPAGRLDPYQQYTVELRTYRGLTSGAVASDVPHTCFHFTNLVSGDTALNIIPYQWPAGVIRSNAVRTVPGREAFIVTPVYWLLRYDGFSESVPPADNVTVTFTYRLFDSANSEIPLRTSQMQFVHPLPGYAAGSPNAPYAFGWPFGYAGDTLYIEPTTQLDSVGKTYKILVSMSCDNGPGQPLLTANPSQTGDTRLLHFSGRLDFGPIETTFTSLANDPQPGTITGTDVRTTLAVNNYSGTVTGSPSHLYGDGTPLDVRLYADGTAKLASGYVTLISLNSPDTDSVKGVNFRRSSVTLNSAGGWCDITATLPAGFGYSINDPKARIVEGTVPFTALQLDRYLKPMGSPAFAPTGGGTLYCAEESKPLWMATELLIWEIANGKFTFQPQQVPTSVKYVRQDHYDYLSNLVVRVPCPLVNPAAADKRSNERYYQFVQEINSGLVEVNAARDGGALLTCGLGVGSGSFRCHFPYDVLLAWSQSGFIQIVDDLVTTNSNLGQVQPVLVAYAQGCGSPCPASAFASVTLLPENSTLRFTRDGGLVAQGAVLGGAVDLNWGNFSSPYFGFAQSASNFTTAHFHMPGTFLRRDQTGLDESSLPAVLLLTGVGAGNLEYLERPDLLGTPNLTNYFSGLADYAGLNFYANDAIHRGRSTLGGTDSGGYDLTSRCKYYIRAAGVSGIQEAVPGTFQPNLWIYGYKFTFNKYGVSYLAPETLDSYDSRTQGSIYVPYPSDFTQNFDRLRFFCAGDLRDAQVPENDLPKPLKYWNGGFATHAIRFEKKIGKNKCDPGGGSLVLGVDTKPSQLDQPLIGDLGFHTNGLMIPRAAQVSGVDSRLKPPNNVRVKAPIGETNGYAFTPRSDVYYNNNTNVTAMGFINLAGELKVPFFEAIKVHLQTSASTNAPDAETAPIYLTGGWPRAGSSGSWKYWGTADSNFFAVPFFDEQNAGYPTEEPQGLAYYRGENRSDPKDDHYRPRAQRNLFGIVELNYPLKWSSGARSFTSRELGDDFLVISAMHQVKYLSSKQAELQFGGQAGLLQLNLANITFKAIGEEAGLLDILAEVLTIINRPGDPPAHLTLTGGLRALDQILTDQMRDLYGPVLDDCRKLPVQDFQSALMTQFSGSPPYDDAARKAALKNLAQQYFQGINPVDLSRCLSNQLVRLVDAPNPSLRSSLSSRLWSVNAAIDVALKMIAKDQPGPDGKRQVGAELVKQLLRGCSLTFAVDAAAGAFNDQLVAAMKGREATYAQLEITLTNVQQQFAVLRNELENQEGFFQELKDRVNNSQGQADIGLITAGVVQDLTNYFNKFNFTVDDPRLREDEIEAMIEKSLEDRFLASPLAADLQHTIRCRIYEKDAALREALDTTFQTINDTLREVLTQWVAMADDALNNWLGDKIGSVGASSRIRGYAHITDDTLKELRLDMRAHLAFAKALKLDFDAYLRILQLQSEGSAGACDPGPRDTTTEVSLGAENVGLDWLGNSGLKAYVGTKFSFINGIPVNMMGKFGLKGKASFQAFEINDFNAAMAVGLLEAYVSAGASVTFNKSTKGSGGFFFGRACDTEPIRIWDPDAADVLTTSDPNRSFTGAYGYVEVWAPVYSQGGCLFEIVAGVGAGGGFFVEGPTLVGKMKLGLGGTVICIVSVRADVTLVGVANGLDLTYKGSCRLHGDIGWCPFCIPFSVGIGVGYWDGDWHVTK